MEKTESAAFPKKSAVGEIGLPPQLGNKNISAPDTKQKDVQGIKHDLPFTLLPVKERLKIKAQQIAFEQ